MSDVEIQMDIAWLDIFVILSILIKFPHSFLLDFTSFQLLFIVFLRLIQCSIATFLVSISVTAI